GAERPAVGAPPGHRLLGEPEVARVAHESDSRAEGYAEGEAPVEAPAALALAFRLDDGGEGKGRDLELLVARVHRAHPESDVLAGGELERRKVGRASRE